MYALLRLTPKNLVSLIVGWLAHFPLPRLFNKWVVGWYIKRYQVDISEITRPPDSYRSLGEFFVRDLVAGSRPLGPGLVSPVDGQLRSHGLVKDKLIPQVKGIDYSVDELLGGKAHSKNFENGYYFNLYLSPRDYHQVHCPIDAKVVSSIYIPGKLWPVNDWAINNVSGLMCRNERVITYLECEFGLMALVMVGALNVGRIRMSYDRIHTNSFASLFSIKARHISVRNYAPEKLLSKGAKLGEFSLGSSVILLLGEKASPRIPQYSLPQAPCAIRMGHSILSS